MRIALLLATLLALAGTSHAESATDRARKHYQSGKELFEAGNREQALVHFELAHKEAPADLNVFMMAQCEYHLGRLKQARQHYEAFLEKVKTGMEAELARLRIEAINARKGRIQIESFPDEVEVRIDGDHGTQAGQGPNDFEVPRGRYRVTISKPKYMSETREITVEAGETKTQFFRLEPIPARLTVRTRPRNAILYVRGNRTRNPYAQQIDPGEYEIYAEATDYEARREVITLAPGEQKTIDFALTYVQRSGRAELIGFWTAAGAIGGGTAVASRLDRKANPSSATLISAGVLAGGAAGAVISTALHGQPGYIRDNLALFRIGAMWIGATEGAALALALEPDARKLSSAWVGGAVGVGVGAAVGTLLDHRAPNYGRVAIIHSGALLGALAGSLAAPALELQNPVSKTPIAVLGGLNLGLLGGLALAYLPDQREYGPTWKRVVLVDLAVAAGAVAGYLTERCSRGTGTDRCSGEPDKKTARYALIGGAAGLGLGWWLTRDYDRDNESPSETTVGFLPLPTVLAVPRADGTMGAVPGLAAQGLF